MFNNSIQFYSFGHIFSRTLITYLNFVLVPIHLLPKIPHICWLEFQGVLGKYLGLFWDRKEIFSTIPFVRICFLACIPGSLHVPHSVPVSACKMLDWI